MVDNTSRIAYIRKSEDLPIQVSQLDRMRFSSLECIRHNRPSGVYEARDSQEPLAFLLPVRFCRVRMLGITTPCALCVACKRGSYPSWAPEVRVRFIANSLLARMRAVFCQNKWPIRCSRSQIGGIGAKSHSIKTMGVVATVGAERTPPSNNEASPRVSPTDTSAM